MKKAEGIDVQVLSGPRFGNLIAHGKMLLVDRSTAVIGSIALSAVCLEFRRELALKTQHSRCVRQLSEFFRFLTGAEVLERGTLKADGNDDDDDDDDEQ
jgi:phosphatidylserine/phosphatidylglycerophosphate/cardiolipin synthase-like enzyme